MIRVGTHLAWLMLGALAMSLSWASHSAAQNTQTQPKEGDKSAIKTSSRDPKEKKLETALFGGGCFWCLEAIYQRVDGVSKVVSGYAGGTVENPNYKQVCTGLTGHAEVCEITFDPEVVSFDELLLVFFKTHDPTTLNQQGADIGTQYRSVVFYADDEQKEATEKMIAKLTDEKVFLHKIVTEVSPLPEFYPAEDYHQNYFNQNKGASYCRYTIAPKVEKFEKLFKEQSKMHKEKEAKKAERLNKKKD